MQMLNIKTKLQLELFAKLVFLIFFFNIKNLVLSAECEFTFSARNDLMLELIRSESGS